MQAHIIAVDLGGTQIRVALCDAQGRIVNHVKKPVAAANADALFGRIVESIRQVAGETSIRGIGLGAPGPLDPWRGVILQAPNLPGMINYPMKEKLEKEFRVPVVVGNDANLAALGEHRLGAGRGAAHMIYMTISTGIGGGIIAGNQLFLGARGFAGEVGHQTLDAYGPRCNCGNVGCLETLAAGPAIVRMAREIYQRAGFFIGLGMVNLLHNFDTQMFVLGGGVAINAWDLIYPAMIDVFTKYAMPSMRRDVQIVPAQLGDDAGLIGAAMLAMEQVP